MKFPELSEFREVSASLTEKNVLNKSVKAGWLRALEQESLGQSDENIRSSVKNTRLPLKDVHSINTDDYKILNIKLVSESVFLENITNKIKSGKLVYFGQFSEGNDFVFSRSDRSDKIDAEISVIDHVIAENKFMEEPMLNLLSFSTVKNINKGILLDSNVFITVNDGLATVWIRDYKGIINKSSIEMILEHIKSFIKTKRYILGNVMLNAKPADQLTNHLLENTYGG